MKELLLFVLPAIIFFLVFSSFAQLSGGFAVFTGLLLFLVCMSNFAAVITSYPVGFFAQNFIVSPNHIQQQEMQELEAVYTLNLAPICDNSTALIIGLLLGIYVSVKKIESLKSFANKGSDIVNFFLSKIFTPVLPIFILGFILKAQHSGLLEILFKNFVPLLSVILCLYVIYIGLFYLIVNEFSISKSISAVKNILSPAIVGFCSMSSAAAMPAMIQGTIRNAQDEAIPKKIIPFITNTHMMGDALAIPLMAMSLYIVEYQHFPAIEEYVIFAISYVLAKFASAGIPGGTILIMTPVLESKLGFTSEMSSIILTTYLLFDPFCTMGSILGNGGFTIMFEKLKSKIMLPKPVIPESTKTASDI